MPGLLEGPWYNKTRSFFSKDFESKRCSELENFVVKGGSEESKSKPRSKKTGVVDVKGGTPFVPHNFNLEQCPPGGATATRLARGPSTCLLSRCHVKTGCTRDHSTQEAGSTSS